MFEITVFLVFENEILFLLNNEGRFFQQFHYISVEFTCLGFKNFNAMERFFPATKFKYLMCSSKILLVLSVKL